MVVQISFENVPLRERSSAKGLDFTEASRQAQSTKPPVELSCDYKRHNRLYVSLHCAHVAVVTVYVEANRPFPICLSPLVSKRGLVQVFHMKISFISFGSFTCEYERLHTGTRSRKWAIASCVSLSLLFLSSLLPFPFIFGLIHDPRVTKKHHYMTRM